MRRSGPTERGTSDMGELRNRYRCVTGIIRALGFLHRIARTWYHSLRSRGLMVRYRSYVGNIFLSRHKIIRVQYEFFGWTDGRMDKTIVSTLQRPYDDTSTSRELGSPSIMA